LELACSWVLDFGLIQVQVKGIVGKVCGVEQSGKVLFWHLIQNSEIFYIEGTFLRTSCGLGKHGRPYLENKAKEDFRGMAQVVEC
jgi:hypothetical protein